MENMDNKMQNEENYLDEEDIITKYQLIRIVSDIISELTKSQKSFFRDLYGTKRSQYKVAQKYGISPQAITNHIKKLKKTVEKRILERTGLTREQISEILGEKSLGQLFDENLEADLPKHNLIKIDGVYKERRLDAETMEMIKESMVIYNS